MLCNRLSRLSRRNCTHSTLLSTRRVPPMQRVAFPQRQTREFFGLGSVQRWLSGLKDVPNEDKMKAVTAHLKPVEHTSPNFGEVLEVEINGQRIWFQSNKIIFGTFNDEWEVEEEYNISRIPNDEYTLDEFEKLRPPIVPPEAHGLSKSYFSNTDDSKETDWSALKIPTIYNLLPELSRAVLGFIVFHGHTGFSFDYDWVSLKSNEEFESDLEKGLQIWEAVRKLEKKEETPAENE